jgi:hypothetical protein
MHWPRPFPRESISPTNSYRRTMSNVGSRNRMAACVCLCPTKGEGFDSAIFHIEPKGWDHTTCDLCNGRIPAAKICYVTVLDPYVALCRDCYEKRVVSQFRRLLWHAKRLAGIRAAA